MEADSEETVQNIANFLKATAKVPEDKQEVNKSERGQSKFKKIESSSVALSKSSISLSKSTRLSLSSTAEERGGAGDMSKSAAPARALSGNLALRLERRPPEVGEKFTLVQEPPVQPAETPQSSNVKSPSAQPVVAAVQMKPESIPRVAHLPVVHGPAPLQPVHSPPVIASAPPAASRAPTAGAAPPVLAPVPPSQTAVPLSALAGLTRLLSAEGEPALLAALHSFLGPDSLRNLCDAVQALALAGETDCSDLETLELYWTVLNVRQLREKLTSEKFASSELQPLTNLGCKTLHCHNLQKLVYKEPNLKGIILKKVGDSVLQEFDAMTNFYFTRGDMFITDNAEKCIYLYHHVRNISLQYVLTKLNNVFVKMKPIFKSLKVSDPEYNTSVDKLSHLMNAEWVDQVVASEEAGYDFDFLFIILKFVKKAKETPPVKAAPEIKPVHVTAEYEEKQVEEASPCEPEQKENQKTVEKPPADVINGKPLSGEDTAKVLTAEQQAVVQEEVAACPPAPPVPVTTADPAVPGRLPVVPAPAGPKRLVISRPVTPPAPRPAPANANPSPAAIIPPHSYVSVSSLHRLKEHLDYSQEPRMRVVDGVGQQAYR